MKLLLSSNEYTGTLYLDRQIRIAETDRVNTSQWGPSDVVREDFNDHDGNGRYTYNNILISVIPVTRDNLLRLIRHSSP